MSLKENIQKRLAIRPTRVFSYLHNDRIGVLVEIEAQTDFALRTPELQALGHNICLQVCAMSPVQLSTRVDVEHDPRALYKQSLFDETPDSPHKFKIIEGKLFKWDRENVLLKQLWIKDNALTIEDMIAETAEALGEEIKLVRFERVGS